MASHYDLATNASMPVGALRRRVPDNGLLVQPVEAQLEVLVHVALGQRQHQLDRVLKSEKRITESIGTKSMPSAQEVDQNALDVATLYLCGASAETCREAQIPEVVRKLIFEGNFFTDIRVHEAARKVLHTIHQARACMWSNDIAYDIDTGMFTTFLKAGRKGQTKVQLDPEKLKQWLNECDKDMVAISISLPGHANMLIIDRARKQVEHFEPHGDSMTSLSEAKNKQFRADVESLMNQIGLRAYKYLPPSEVCPDFAIGSSYVNEFGQRVEAKKVGIQGFLNQNRASSEFAGTCAIWSLWYAHVRLSNPQLDAAAALKQAMGLAVGMADAKFPTGLPSYCINALVSDEYCSRTKTPAGETEGAIKKWREDCQPACEHVQKLQRGGLKLEEFIIQFTLELISLLQLEIVTSFERHCAGNRFYTFASKDEGDAYTPADDEGCKLTTKVEKVVSSDGRVFVHNLQTQYGDSASEKRPRNIPLPDAATYVVYGRPGCPFCIKAKNLIATHKLDGIYVSKPDYDADAYHELIRPQHPEHNTVPVVFYNSKFIGGYTELDAHVKAQSARKANPVPTSSYDRKAPNPASPDKLRSVKPASQNRNPTEASERSETRDAEPKPTKVKRDSTKLLPPTESHLVKPTGPSTETSPNLPERTERSERSETRNAQPKQPKPTKVKRDLTTQRSVLTDSQSMVRPQKKRTQAQETRDNTAKPFIVRPQKRRRNSARRPALMSGTY